MAGLQLNSVSQFPSLSVIALSPQVGCSCEIASVLASWAHWLWPVFTKETHFNSSEHHIFTDSYRWNIKAGEVEVIERTQSGETCVCFRIVPTNKQQPPPHTCHKSTWIKAHMVFIIFFNIATSPEAMPCNTTRSFNRFERSDLHILWLDGYTGITQGQTSQTFASTRVTATPSCCWNAIPMQWTIRSMDSAAVTRTLRSHADGRTAWIL